jgi:hypothetical protein
MCVVGLSLDRNNTTVIWLKRHVNLTVKKIAGEVVFLTGQC